MSDRPVVACISLEAWDGTWRRNQHFASRLVAQGHVSRLVFVEPPLLGRGARPWSPQHGVVVVRPPMLLPKRAGGLQLVGALLRRGHLRTVDVLWINDPRLGRYCIRPGGRAVYDVTDDLRTFEQPEYITARIVRAEDALAAEARTVVCSEVLAERWQERYAVRPVLVRNAVDVDAFAAARPMTPLPGPPPHVGYVGTLHAFRLDVDLVLSVADRLPGTLHLVGPDALDAASRARLASHRRIRLHGPVDAADVPRWMTSMDVLTCPHLVNPFTLSLDAIKSYEYLAAGRPVVATPTSGFQAIDVPGVTVVSAADFPAAVLGAVGGPAPTAAVTGWADRTREFAAALLGST